MTPSAPAPPRTRWIDASLAAALVVAAAHALAHAGFTMDDAGISYAYARSLADGLGLGVLDAGGQRVEGYSNLAWVLLLALARRVGIPIPMAAKVLAAACFLGSAWLLHALVSRVVRRPALAAAAVLFPASACVGLWSMSGLETPLYLLLLLAAARLLLSEEAAPSPWRLWSAPFLLLVGVTRPEGFVFAGAALASKLLGLASSREGRRARLGHLAAWTAVVVLGYAGYFGWHISAFGYPFPNTVYAKGGSPSVAATLVGLADPRAPGWQYVGSWAWERAGLLLFPAALVGAVAALRGPARAVAAFAGAAALLPLARPDWMVEHRFLVPLVPFIVALGAVGVDEVLDLAERRSSRAGRLVAAAGIAAGLAYGAVNARASAERRAAGYAGAVTMESIRALYAGMFDAPVKELGLSRPLVALPDLGATTFQLRMRVVDLAALADAQLAHATVAEELELYLLEERRPELLHAHGGWASAIGAVKRFQVDYVPFVASEGGLEAVRKDLFVDRRPSALRTPLGGAIELSDLDAPAAVEPGATVTVDLFLSSPEDAPAPVDLRLRLVRADGGVVTELAVPCGPSFFPPARWARGERVRQRAVLPAPREGGPLTLQVVARGPGEREGAVRLARSVVVDREAARASALERQASARSLAQAGEVEPMHRVLDAAEAAAPAAAPWDSVREACVTTAARAIAEGAESFRTRAPPEWLVSYVRRAESLGAARGAPELRALASRLRGVADAERDPIRAYLWRRAAWYADPQDADGQRGLIAARRALFPPAPVAAR